VRWPNGRVETWHDLAVDQFHTRGEGSGHAPQMVRAVTVVLCRKGDSPLPSR
jgi:urease alpha subunit